MGAEFKAGIVYEYLCEAGAALPASKIARGLHLPHDRVCHYIDTLKKYGCIRGILSRKDRRWEVIPGAEPPKDRRGGIKGLKRGAPKVLCAASLDRCWPTPAIAVLTRPQTGKMVHLSPDGPVRPKFGDDGAFSLERSQHGRIE